MSKILLVEDSKSLRTSINYFLTQNSFVVDEAECVEVALEKMETHSYDLIITDINMPGINGITFIKKVKTIATHKYTPIIVLSTENQQSKIEEGKKAGATGWLTKPFPPEKLITIVNKLIS